MIESGLDRPKSAFREGLLVFLAALFCVGLYQAQPGMVVREDGSRFFGFKARSLPEGDSTYNIRLAWLYRTGAVSEAGDHFHWMSSSIWAHEFCDKEFLYHLYLAPFTLGARDVRDTGALIWGAKLATSVLFALLALTLWAVLRGFGVRHAWCYVPLIAVLGGMVFANRAEETRAWPMGVICSLVAWLLMAKNRRLALLLVAAVYTLAYSAVHFLIMLWFVRTLLAFALGAAPGGTRKIELQRHLWLLAAIFAGVTLGVLLHPGRAHFANMWVVTYLLVPVSNLQGSMQEAALGVLKALGLGRELPRAEVQRLKLGVEFLPKAGGNLLFNGGAAMLTPLALGAASAWQQHKPSRETLFALGAALMTLCMFIASSRFAEIMGPFMALAAGLWLDELFKSTRLKRRMALAPERLRRLGFAGRSTFVAALVVFWVFVLYDREPPLPRPWRDAALWMRDNPDARGKVMFHSRWDVFPDFFFYAPRSDYIVGMDPNYLLAHDAGKSSLYWDIYENKVDAATVMRIKREFGAEYVMVMPPHTPALDKECRRLAEEKRLSLVYVDEYYSLAIYQFND
jgi:hypothetical protein